MLRRLLNLLPSEILHGYEHPELIETVFRKTIAYEPCAPWPEMNGVDSVLDFGGACGRHYKEARQHSLAIRWAVVETPAMVARARELETRQLRFFTTINEACEWLGAVEIVHSNGALQYTPDPNATLRSLCDVRAKRMLWFRLLLGREIPKMQISRLADNGPGNLRADRRKISYEQTPISEDSFLEAHRDYQLVGRGTDWFKFVK